MNVYIVEKVGDLDNHQCFAVFNNIESAYNLFLEKVKQFPTVIQYTTISSCERLPYAEYKDTLFQIVKMEVQD